jgi:hypothetical protein
LAGVVAADVEHRESEAGAGLQGLAQGVAIALELDHQLGGARLDVPDHA